MKKTLAILLALVLTLGMAVPLGGVVVNAAEIIGSGRCGENLTWTLDRDGVLTISGSGDMWDFEDGEPSWYWIIKEDLFMMPVMPDDYEERISGVTVNIEPGVTSISDKSFAECEVISVSIPDSVTRIGERAFYSNRLTDIAIPGSVTHIGANAFYSNRLTDIAIPAGVTYIGIGAFSGAELENITVTADNSVYHTAGNCLIETASKTLICGCKNSVIPTDGSVTGIGDYAFSCCSGLTSVTIPDSVTSIGNVAFSGCSLLTSITIPDSVTSIGGSAFSGCSSLTSITIPDNATIIGGLFFRGCSSLTSITIPDSVTSIGNNAFEDCSSLTSITIPDGVTSIGDFAFEDCSSLTSVTIPDSVTSIDYGAFSGCSSLTSIKIPKGVTYVDCYTFGGCNLTSIIVDVNNPVYHSAGNCLIETASKKLIIGCTSSLIPEDGSVTSIGSEAFSCCGCPTSITIPDGVTIIDDNAFGGCSNLTSIAIPRTVVSIGYEAFVSWTDADRYVFYAGSQSDWLNIENNDAEDLEKCIIHYNATDHTFAQLEEAAPTCTEDGHAAGYACTVCGFSEEEIEIIPSTGHTDENYDGLCDVCGEMCAYIIHEGETVSVEVEQKKESYVLFIPEQSGVYAFYAVSDEDTYGTLYARDRSTWLTADDDGNGDSNFKIVYSLSAGEVYYYGVRYLSSSQSGSFDVKLELVEAINDECDHVWDGGAVTKEATCKEEGTKLFTCAECGETKTETVAKNPGNHASYGTVVKNAADATCETDGYTGDVCCKGCGAVLTTGETIPATGHGDADGDGICDDCGAQVGEGTGEQESNCPCGKYHTGPFAGLIIFFHKIVYFFKNLLK